MEGQRPQLCQSRLHILGLFGEDGGIHHAVVAELPGQGPGVHAGQAGNALLPEIILQRALGAEIAGRIAQFTHHIARQPGPGALEILGDHAVVADAGEGLDDDLSVVAGVGQRLQVAHHGRGEDQLRPGALLRAVKLALQQLAVLQQQITLLDHAYSPFMTATITAFWACRRFSASSKISSAWASKTSAVISSPRWAGRQCCTMQSGCATAISSLLT